jgi:hypothetical protein
VANVIENARAHQSDAVQTLDLAVADAVWVGVALLHLRFDKRSQFSVDEIVESVAANHLTNRALKSVRSHAQWHCVANLPARPNRSCMLFATRESDESGGTHRRIFRDCDVNRIHPDRRGAPTHPVWGKLPEQYAYLRDWYEIERKKGSEQTVDPLLALAGTGRGMFGDQGADAYVNSLREGWGDTR